MENENQLLTLSENEYKDLLNTAITQINTTRNTLAVQVNTAVTSTYWNLGKLLHDKKIENGYGTKIVERISVDLKTEFSGYGAFSTQFVEYEVIL
jgi:hypothetical protein